PPGGGGHHRRPGPGLPRAVPGAGEGARRRPRRARRPSGGRGWRRLAGRDLRDGGGRWAQARSSVPSPVSRLPRPTERPAGGLAAGEARPRGRHPAPAGGRGRRHTSGMSVGLQRLREDSEAVRRGAVDKGEDPGIVDAALAADARRRELQGDADGLRAERNAVSKQIGEAIKGGARPDGPEVADLRHRSTEVSDRLTAIETELAQREAEVEDLLLRIPNPAEADVPVGGEEANVTVRTWGEQLARTQPVEGEVGADAVPGSATWERRPHWELAEALDIIDLPR